MNDDVVDVLIEVFETLRYQQDVLRQLIPRVEALVATVGGEVYDRNLETASTLQIAQQAALTVEAIEMKLRAIKRRRAN